MSTRIIAFVAGLLSVTAVAAGLYYGTDLLEGNRSEPTRSSAAETEAPDQQDAAPMVETAGETEAESETEATAEAGAIAPPSIDIVRVEPSGEIVTAGRSDSAAEIELLLKDEIIAQDTANNDGHWTLVPEAPLPKGSHELVLRAKGGAGASVEGDRVTIIVEGEGEMPLVAVTPRGAPTTVLQRAAERQLASADDSAMQEPLAAPDGIAASDRVAPVTSEAEAETEPAGASHAEPMVPQSGEERIALAIPDATAEAVSLERRSGQAPVSGDPDQDAVLEMRPAAEPAEQPSAASDPASGAASTGEQTLAIDAVEVEEPDDIHLSGQAEPDASVRLYVNEEHLGDVRSDAEGRWAATVEREVSPGRYAVRADVVGEEGAVEERAEVRFDRVRVTLAEESRDGTVGPDGEEDQPAGLDGGPGEVYIERGDNLWRIARAIYGQGIRYTAIYDANRAQIRDPDLIYPGQVFTIPLPEADD